MPRVEVLQQASEISWLAAIEIKIEFGIISVSPVGVAPERTERDQRVEEVARAAFVNSGPARESRKIERTFRQHREYAELHRAEQCFRSPERVSDLKNPFWRLVLPPCRPVWMKFLRPPFSEGAALPSGSKVP